ncbi:SGNH/GDSL hydrolase family protein [Actibacterium mucosum]|nr:SGNH/GDSL hydrolase family protein [Actibacterium mucosum]
MIDLTNVSRVAAFGASNTDTGNLYDLTGQLLWVPIPADDLGYQQSHTNGDVSIEYSLDLWGITSFDNYAVSGARAYGKYPLLWFLIESNVVDSLKWNANIDLLNYDINLGAQVGRFLSDNDGVDLSDTMTVLDIGVLDYARYQNVSTENPVLEMFIVMKLVTDELRTSAQALADAGVGTIVLNSMTNPKFMPRGDGMTEGQKSLFDWIVKKHNTELETIAADLTAAGHNVVVVDIHAIMEEIYDDASAFGFIAPLDLYTVHDNTGEALSQNIEGFDDDQVAYYDATHGTTAYHGVVGAFEAKALTAHVTIDDDANSNIIGTDEDDLVLAKEGHDNIILNDGDDVALGGLGNDTANGGAGRDLINGGAGDDELEGGADADVLAGADGDDILRGGEGQDVLIGGLGNNQMFGDGGDDQFLFTQGTLIGGDNSGVNTIDGGAGHDTLYLVLDGNTRLEYDVNGNGDLAALASSLGLDLTSIEEIILLDSRADLAGITSDALIHEADLWGMI